MSVFFSFVVDAYYDKNLQSDEKEGEGRGEIAPNTPGSPSLCGTVCGAET